MGVGLFNIFIPLMPNMLNEKRAFYCVFMVFISIFSTSCTQENISNDKVIYYFDLAEFYKAEAARLQAVKPVVKKAVMLNGKTEEQQLTINDWNNEFLTFSDADINKSAYVGKYTTDTLFVNNKIRKISYRANEKKLKTRLLEVEFDTIAQTPEHIHLMIETKNTLYHSFQTLHYWKNKSYSVEGRQEIRLLNPDVFKVQVNF
jgi:hypothetical protein